MKTRDLSLANVKIPMGPFLMQVAGLHHTLVRGAAGALALANEHF